MKGFIIAIIVIAALLIVGGGAVAYKIIQSDDDSVVDKVADKVSNVQSSSSDIVKEEIKENGQAGSGSYKEVQYEDGGFRQYDSNTGELIGSSYDSDQAKLNKGDFD
ncbi:MAG: flagellar protein, FliL [Methanobrevibacter sp.]|uniref:flagellar protein, FliL n=1 Tax=uncultured Methanobrevibacter sp. TaxID=253161 RepID=UPI0025D8A5EA|nr:flagellar protein, FliL [uncultured Methanobrevibacter sp.]MEE1129967.1 flagellar protein, FliL [Methanobrevibacter sp.]